MDLILWEQETEYRMPATFFSPRGKDFLNLSVRMASSGSLAADRETPEDRTQLDYRYVLQLAIVFALYFGAGKLGLAIPFTSSNVSPIGWLRE